MFYLTTSELDDARAAIDHHGYSAMLPPPPEWSVVTANWATVRDAIERIDLDTYVPLAPLRTFAPKGRATIRPLHMLHPQDLVIYTALTLAAKNVIENARAPTTSKRVFSYRADVATPGQLYASAGSYDAYRAELRRKAGVAQVKYVAVADIADFYPRIYQHRLENVIETVASTQRVRDVARILVRKLIGNLMSRDSYGIPVGPYASRLLAEALLIDVDSSLQGQGVDFVRWVDDFTIFCRTEYEAQSVLFALGEWLFSKHGLTLQSAKTRIVPIDTYRSKYLVDHDDNLTGRDAVMQMLRGFRTGRYGGQGEDDEDLDEGAVDEALAVLQGNDLKGMLEASMADSQLVDYAVVTFALQKLPLIPGAPAKLKRAVLKLVIDNAQLLYPVAEHIASYVLSFDDLTAAEQKRIAVKLLRPLKDTRRPPPPYYAMWILHIFASSASWNHAQDIAALYRATSSELVRRHAALAVEVSGTRAEALALRDEYVAASPLVQTAILFATRRLGSDERKNWR